MARSGPSAPASLALLSALLRRDAEAGAGTGSSAASGAARPAISLTNPGDLDASLADIGGAAALFEAAGVCVFRDVLGRKLVEACREATVPLLARVDAAIASRGDVHPDDDFESAEACRRGRRRLDVRGYGMGAPPLDDTRLHGEAVWLPFVRATLGQSAHECFRGIVDNRPGSTRQEWHRDGPMPEGERPRCLTIFVPLVDIDESAGVRASIMRMSPLHCRPLATGARPLAGPTHFFPGSHAPFRAALYDDLEADDHAGQLAHCAPLLERGGFVAFDYRVVHRGSPNTRATRAEEDAAAIVGGGDAVCAGNRPPQLPLRNSRPVLYVVFACEGYADTHNFPADRPLFPQARIGEA